VIRRPHRVAAAPTTLRPRPNAGDRACRPSPSRSPRRTHPRIRGRPSLRTLRGGSPPSTSRCARAGTAGAAVARSSASRRSRSAG
jgi:hypothetical protein